MGNILLVKIGDKSYPPYGLLYISSVLSKNKKNKIRIIHIDNPSVVLKNKNLIKDADIVGFSVITSPYLKDIIDLSKKIKNIYKKKIIWGGPHPTMVPEIVLKEKYVDFVILGEGEERLSRYLDLIIKDHLCKDCSLDGIGFKDNRKLFIYPPTYFITDLDNYEIDWSRINLCDYIIKSYLGNKFHLITSRGCYRRCGFCYNNFFYKNIWRAHSANYVLEQINYLKKRNINYIDFIADDFFGDIKRAFDIVYKIKIPWSAEVYPGLINEDFIKRCKESGCIGLYLGIESGSKKILKKINKDMSLERIINAVKLITDKKIKVTCSFIIGFPGEVYQDLKDTFKLIKKLISISKLVDIQGPKIYTPYPNTPLYNKFFINNASMPKTNLEYAYYPTRFDYNKAFWFSTSRRALLKRYYLATRLLYYKFL